MEEPLADVAKHVDWTKVAQAKALCVNAVVPYFQIKRLYYMGIMLGVAFLEFVGYWCCWLGTRSLFLPSYGSTIRVCHGLNGFPGRRMIVSFFGYLWEDLFKMFVYVDVRRGFLAMFQIVH